jgi:hypothetical protein
MAPHVRRHTTILGGLLTGVVATVGLTACLPEDLGGAFVIVNQSDETLFFGAADIPLDGRYIYGVQGCVRPGLELRDGAGEVVVHVEEKVCANQILTVRGPGDYTLQTATDG